MDFKAIEILTINIDQLANESSEWIKENYPTRTRSFDKCVRDMKFVLNALIAGVKDKSTLAIDHVVGIFYRGGKLQLQSTDVEVAVYERLKIKVAELLKQNDISQDTIDAWNGLVNIFVYRLKNGIEFTESEWTNRRNYKIYDTEVQIPETLERRLDTILQNVPLQSSGVSNFVLCKAKHSDREITEFLVKEYFKNDYGAHMVALCTAPLVYLALPAPEDVAKNLDRNNWILESKLAQIGIHGGVLCNEVIRHGYDFSFIGCTIDNPTEEAKQKWVELATKRWNVGLNIEFPWPLLTFCMGRAIKETYTTLGKERKEYTMLDGSIIEYDVLFEKEVVRKGNILVH